MEVAARLRHPNIVTAFDAGEQDGVAYLVTEFVDGEDLGRLVRREGPLAVDRAVAFVRQAALGLAYAHAQGVVHRDVKPSNLILGRDGVVRVLDVGLARAAPTPSLIANITEFVVHRGSHWCPPAPPVRRAVLRAADEGGSVSARRDKTVTTVQDAALASCSKGAPVSVPVGERPLCRGSAEPTTPPQQGDDADPDREHHDEDRGIAVPPVQSGHDLEVHPVDAGDQREGQEHGRDHRQDPKARVDGFLQTRRGLLVEQGDSDLQQPEEINGEERRLRRRRPEPPPRGEHVGMALPEREHGVELMPFRAILSMVLMPAIISLGSM